MNDEHHEDKAAFPRVVTPGFEEVAPGMTLWDYFAAAALKGACSRESATGDTHAERAEYASGQADAMIEARKTK